MPALKTLKWLMLAYVGMGAALAAGAGEPGNAARLGAYANHPDSVWVKQSPRQSAPSPR